MIESLKKSLESSRFAWSLRDGFIFIQSENRSLEVSADGETLWLEFWSNSDEASDDPPVKECECGSVVEAVNEIEKWLNEPLDESN